MMAYISDLTLTQTGHLGNSGPLDAVLLTFYKPVYV
jgi:hypothetical protein